MFEHPPASITILLPTEKNKNAATNTSNTTHKNKFQGDGVSFKGKLIGTECLSVDRDEKLCLDVIRKLKAAVRSRGEHKKKVRINLTMNAIKLIDTETEKQIAYHEIEKISFALIDPGDLRVFGYTYKTSDNRLQFWAIKTPGAAATTVIVLKEIFELAFEEYKNAEATNNNDPTNKHSETIEPTEKMVSTAKILAIAAGAILIVAWVFYVAGNAAPSWATSSITASSSSINYGLWKVNVCFSGTCSEAAITCDSSSTSCSKVQAARAFMTLACIFTPFAAACLILIAIMDKFERMFLLIAKGLASVCFVFGLIGMAVGLSYATDISGTTVGAAGGVAIVGVILNLIAVIVAAIIRPV